jgi:hypothetical protein
MAMMPGQIEMAQDRMRSLRAEAAAQRDARRALAHGRVLRQARRAECQTAWHAEEASRLRAKLAALEAGTMSA